MTRGGTLDLDGNAYQARDLRNVDAWTGLSRETKDQVARLSASVRNYDDVWGAWGYAAIRKRSIAASLVKSAARSCRVNVHRNGTAAC